MDFEGSWTERHGLKPDPVPTSGFYSKEYFDKENENIFKKCWLFACKATDIPNPGDFVVEDIPSASASVIIVRGKDNQIRAFHNICSHRGNLLVWENEGNCNLMTCRYHAWVFDLKGNLRGINDQPNFFDVDKKKLGLKPVAMENWAGLIFINLDPQPAQSFKEYIGDLYDQLSDFPFHEFTRTYEWTAEMDCNYKVIRDAFAEMYHTPIIHKYSSGETLVTPNGEHGHCHPVYTALFKNAGQFSCYGTAPKTLNPIQSIVASIPGVQDARGQTGKTLPGLNPSKSNNWSNDITHIFPYFSLVLFPDLLFIHKFKPVSADKMKWHFQVIYREPKNAGERFAQEYGKVHVRDAVLEDIATVERTHRALKSGFLPEITLSDQEILVRAGHQYTQALAGPYEVHK